MDHFDFSFIEANDQLEELDLLAIAGGFAPSSDCKQLDCGKVTCERFECRNVGVFFCPNYVCNIVTCSANVSPANDTIPVSDTITQKK